MSYDRLIVSDIMALIIVALVVMIIVPAITNSAEDEPDVVEENIMGAWHGADALLIVDEDIVKKVYHDGDLVTTFPYIEIGGSYYTSPMDGIYLKSAMEVSGHVLGFSIGDAEVEYFWRNSCIINNKTPAVQ